MTRQVHHLTRFEPFEVRLPTDKFEVMLRLEWGGTALLLWVASVAWMAVALHVGSQELFLFVPSLIFACLALVVSVPTARRWMCWRVDGEGIHQRCWGLRNWDLPWTAIRARSLGPYRQKRVLLLNFVLPILSGPYQAILLEDHAGRTRRVNRLARNGDRLDAMVRSYLNPTEEAELAERHDPGRKRGRI
jgi:hypothetical protein